MITQTAVIIFYWKPINNLKSQNENYTFTKMYIYMSSYLLY